MAGPRTSSFFSFLFLSVFFWLAWALDPKSPRAPGVVTDELLPGPLTPTNFIVTSQPEPPFVAAALYFVLQWLLPLNSLE